jgi:hypothetical protein
VLATFVAPVAVYEWRWDARLDVESFDTLVTHDAYVGATYNVPISFDVLGRGAVRIVSARARYTDPGLRQVPPLVGTTCDGTHVFPVGAVGADLNRDPDLSVAPLDHLRLRAGRDANCRFLLLRFVPERLGTLSARDVEVVYVVAGTRRVARFSFVQTYEVGHTGRDPREYNPPMR